MDENNLLYLHMLSLETVKYTWPPVDTAVSFIAFLVLQTHNLCQHFHFINIWVAVTKPMDSKLQPSEILVIYFVLHIPIFSNTICFNATLHLVY